MPVLESAGGETMSKVEILGISKLNRKLDSIQKGVNSGLVRVAKKATLYVHSRLPGYPVPSPTSSYRRTGLLGRSITTGIKPLGNAVAGVIGTKTVYAPWVISRRRVGGRGPQARTHKSRWWTLQNEVARHRKAIVGMYRKFIRNLLK
jgi:hypothetical protein